MTSAPACPFEADVLDLALLGHWPDRAAPALRTHAEACAVCTDVAGVASGLAAWQEAALSAVRVPDASRVWRDAGQRARQDATRRATWPVRVVELAAAAMVGLLGVAWAPGLAALAGIPWSPGDWLSSAWRSLASGASGLAETWAAVQLPEAVGSTLGWGLLTLAAWTIVIPVAFSLAGLADRTSGRDNGHSKPAR